jgi:hypothetical protein
MFNKAHAITAAVGEVALVEIRSAARAAQRIMVRAAALGRARTQPNGPNATGKPSFAK